MAGMTCIVTGATAGIGEALARGLAERHASLALVGRDEERLARVSKECEERGAPVVHTFRCDFAVLDQVRELSVSLLEDLPRIDVLVNNAGLVVQRRQETADGHELVFAVNQLAPYLLTRLLLDRLVASAPARIVWTASDAHEFGPLQPEDYMSTGGYRPLKAYGRSKLANILTTAELARRLEGTGVTANSFHPGFVSTSLARDHPLGTPFLKLIRPFIRSAAQGADTGIHLAADDIAENGQYFYKRKVHGTKNDALDPVLGARLWDDCAALVGLS
ncbi:MAG TPA: SDR family NAD(P)-dependent oxidoreductase [Mycobacteriales bacterium]|nr:SDR family NAD(P)-dependent oxidoreductase [Mycobacteriales bacterium]